jgi:release factor glutamine methyltransferase
MTITSLPAPVATPAPAGDVYLPQEDSRLLVETLAQTVSVAGRSVLDLCTGSGVVAIAAARLGARSVAAWDICPQAVLHSRREAAAAGVAVDVRLGSWARARSRGPFDVVVANPPYVPADPESLNEVDGPTWAWDAGPDGRLVIDPLCAAAPQLLSVGGTLLFVQSEFTGVEQSLAALSAAGLSADVVARQRIPFGPVLTSRARFLEDTGRLATGCREEELVVIRADRL